LGLKRATATPPAAHCTALWGEGKGGCYLYGLEDLLNKNMSYI
jgi:hypothetical protein